MGMDSTGILAYGYDLGSSDTEWNFIPSLRALDWYDEDDYLEDQLMKRMLKVVVGFDEVWYPGNKDFHVRESAAKEKLGVQIATYGTDGYRGYILATTVHKVSDYGAEAIDLIMIDHSASTKLHDALDALGIKPTQPAGWILGSYYG